MAQKKHSSLIAKVFRCFDRWRNGKVIANPNSDLQNAPQKVPDCTPESPTARLTSGSDGGLNLVVVDDDQFFLQLWQETAGTQLTTISSPSDFATWLADQSNQDLETVDAIITDYYLADGFTGSDIYDQIQERSSKIPIFLATNDISRAQERCFTSILPKNPASAVRAIKDHIGHSGSCTVYPPNSQVALPSNRKQEIIHRLLHDLKNNITAWQTLANNPDSQQFEQLAERGKRLQAMIDASYTVALTALRELPPEGLDLDAGTAGTQEAPANGATCAATSLPLPTKAIVVGKLNTTLMTDRGKIAEYWPDLEWQTSEAALQDFSAYKYVFTADLSTLSHPAIKGQQIVYFAPQTAITIITKRILGILENRGNHVN